MSVPVQNRWNRQMHIPSTPATNLASALMSCSGDDSKIEIDGARRNVRAILIAGDQNGCPGMPAPGAMNSLDVIEQHLTSRFSSNELEIERLQGRPTRQFVTNAFLSMTKVVRSEELFVVMFAGHGVGASISQHAQSWSLTEGEAFTDIDLATALLELAPGVDTVVLSDCCFGEGLFQVERLAHRSSEQPPTNSPMVCISAAGRSNLVELTRLVNLASETVAAADAMHSYRQLSNTFAAQAVAGCTFHVDARPAHRLDDLVLSPEPRRSITPNGRPVMPNRRPPLR